MGFFSKMKFALGVGGPPDLYAADPDTAALITRVKGSDMSTVTPTFAALTDGLWAERSFLLDALAPHCNPQVLDAWCQNERENPIPLLLHGARSIEEAWDARGGGHASGVSDEGWEAFGQGLARAKEYLEYAAGLDPRDPTPHRCLVDVAKGLDDRPAAEAHFREVVKRDPLHFPAHASMLTVLCEKWHGSHDEMFGLARDAAQRAPDGAELPLLLIHAHVERWLYSYNFEDDVPAAEQWLARPDVQEEAATAWARSIGSPQYRPSRFLNHRRNWAGFWFYLVRDTQRLRHCLEPLGDLYTEVPWAWDHQRGSEVENYKAARKMAGL